MPQAAEFVAQLRIAVQSYYAAVDAWETAYAKFYRLPDRNQVSSDLEGVHRDYIRTRKALLELIPQAKRLCLKYDLGDPWPGILRIDLGSQAPQVASGPAIGRGERNRIAECLDRIEEGEWVSSNVSASPPPPQMPDPPRGVLHKILGFFF
jgi:hypothetical protein